MGKAKNLFENHLAALRKLAEKHELEFSVILRTAIRSKKNQISLADLFDREKEERRLIDAYRAEYFESLVDRLYEDTKDAIEHFGAKKAKEMISKAAKAKAEKLHSKPGGNRDKQNQIRSLWASGKYSARDICAEQECAAIGMSFSAARKALRNTPDPT